MRNSKKVVGIILIFACLSAIVLSALYSRKHEKYPAEEKLFVAMDTIVTAKLYGEELKDDLEKIQGIVNSLEMTVSRFREDSAVARLNAGEDIENKTVASAAKTCIEISEATDGRFDITVAELSDLWDIGGEEPRIPEKEEIASAVQKTGYENIVLEGDALKLREGVRVDFGAVGKGMACDTIKTYLSMTDIPGAVVSVGGSILAYGTSNAAQDKWQIAIAHPRNEGELLGVLKLEEGFVSTSGDYERYFEQDGKRYHHILDAGTGYPAESDLISVTVICDSGILSDALSTACFILGKQQSLPLIEKYGASAVFVDKDMNISVVGDVDFEY